MTLNLLDYAILLVFALFLFGGVYKGFLSTLFSIGAFIVSWLVSILCVPLGARAVKSSEALFNMMLYYTEGSEYIADAELSRMPISALSTAEINEIVSAADVPYPMGKRILENIAEEAFAAEGVATIGDYFNQTIVCVFINILVFLVVFAIIRLVLGFILSGVDYAWKLPQLRAGDGILGGGLGLVHGILALFLFFMLLPIGLVFLAGKLQFVTDMINGSFFAHFFYRSNFLLGMMPGV
ncbi:MAG: hypothetical protein IJB22_03815 [Clostridia bacterium]|nr:hypothetical protein [Clostridia bacterium]MBQ7113746.1 hypothetical protein [Clostridia bacterium]